MRHQAPHMSSEGGCWAAGARRGDPGHCDLVGAVIHEVAAEFDTLRELTRKATRISIVTLLYRSEVFIASVFDEASRSSRSGAVL